MTWLAMILSMACVWAHAGSPSPDEAYLDGLHGQWIMSGTLGGKPVTYHVVGGKVLDGGWMRLRLVDIHEPPAYQADVFIAYDAKAGDFIAHWLDQFGAGGARVVATGHRDRERLVLVFPYADGAFRDTFQRDTRGDSWTLLIESQAKDGAWSTFATYRLTR